MSRLRKLPLSIVAAGASLVAAQPAFAVGSEPQLVPFHGTFAGISEVQVALPRLFVAGSSEGHATHLGAAVWTFDEIVTLGQVVAGCPTRGTTGTYAGTLTAANGDTITVVGSGAGCPTSPTTARILGAVTVTGGTGRFDGASGTLTSVTLVDQPARTFVVTFDGEVSTPGEHK